jgi:hypothetical protein
VFSPGRIAGLRTVLQGGGAGGVPQVTVAGQRPEGPGLFTLGGGVSVSSLKTVPLTRIVSSTLSRTNALGAVVRRPPLMSLPTGFELMTWTYSQVRFAAVQPSAEHGGSGPRFVRTT